MSMFLKLWTIKKKNSNLYTWGEDQHYLMPSAVAYSYKSMNTDLVMTESIITGFKISD